MNVARAAALALVSLGFVALVLARDFTVAFPTDPLGPRAFPWLAAGLLVVCGVWTTLRAKPHPGEGPSAPPARAWLALLSFPAFALALDPLGFVAATTLEFGLLARLFGGRWTAGLGVGALFSVALFLLFVQGLGLPLPTGGWIPGGG